MNNFSMTKGTYNIIKPNTLISIYKSKIKEQGIVISDLNHSYHKLMTSLQIMW